MPGTITVEIVVAGTEAQALALKNAIATLPTLPGGARIQVTYTAAV